MSKLSISGCISAGYSSVILQTPEENRALADCLRAGQHYQKRVYYWSCTRGIMEVVDPRIQIRGDKNYIDMEDYYLVEENADVTDPQEALTEGLKLNDEQGEYILCMLDFHHFVDQPLVLRAAKEAFENGELKAKKETIKNSLKSGLTLEQISNIVNLPINEILVIQNEINNNQD